MGSGGYESWSLSARDRWPQLGNRARRFVDVAARRLRDGARRLAGAGARQSRGRPGTPALDREGAASLDGERIPLDGLGRGPRVDGRPGRLTADIPSPGARLQLTVTTSDDNAVAVRYADPPGVPVRSGTPCWPTSS